MQIGRIVTVSVETVKLTTTLAKVQKLCKSKEEQVMVEGKQVTLELDNQIVKGEITHLYPNDMEVKITFPYTGKHTGVHVPHFMMAEMNWLSTKDGQITERGIQKAETLLRELYQSFKPDQPSQG